MMDWAGLLDEFVLDTLGEKGANVLTAFMLDNSYGSVCVGEK